MELDIQIDDNKKVSAQMKSATFQSEFNGVGFKAAIEKLQRLILEERASRMNIKEYIEKALQSFEIGDTAPIDTLGRDVKNFRVRMAMASKKLGLKFKTKVINGQLTATRVE